MKIKKYILIFNLIAVLGILLFPSKVLAADTPIIGGKLDRHVKRVSTYIGTGATSFQVLVKRAADNWSNPGWTSNVGFAYAPNSQGTMLDIYCFPKADFGGSTVIDALTYWHRSDGSMVPWPSSGTYRYSIIRGNTDALNKLTIDQRTAVFAHEMGHAFGLDHNSSTSSIMYSESKLRSIKVQKSDTNPVNRLYP